MTLPLARKIKLAEVPVNSEIDGIGRGGAGIRFRESRIEIPDGLVCLLKWRDFYGTETAVSITDLSRYGCRVVLANDRISEKVFVKIPRAEILIEGTVSYSGPITFVNERKEADGTYTAGVTLEGTGCDLDVLNAATGLRSMGIDNDLNRVLQVSQAVKSEFKILIADLNALLQEAKQKLEREEMRLIEISTSDNHRYRLEERAITVAHSIYGPRLQGILSQFQTLVAEMTVDEEVPHKQYFKLNFQSLVKGTPFVERGAKKPLGYSGDYGMMVMLYEYFDQGDSLFNRFFHRFVCSEPAAVANRNRVGFLSDILLAGFDRAIRMGAKKFKIVSVACGPAREIYEFLKFASLSSEVPVEIVLIDSEPHALDYARSRLREISVPEKSLELVFLKEDAVTGIIQRKDFVSWLRDSDFIISAGLFDYLTDRVSQRMISSLTSDLKHDGGTLLIGNISKKSPDVFAMDYFMDWRLILRDEPDLLALVPSADEKNSTESDIISESLGLNLFLRVRKK